MGNAVNVNALRGLLVHDSRITEAAFSKTLSTYSQAGAQPGVPVPQRESDMVLETVGTTTASGGALEVMTVRAGGASYNVNGEVQPGAFAWRQAAGSWLGSNGPGVVSGWSPLHTFGSGGTDYKYAFAHALQTSEGTFLVAARRYTTLGTFANLVVIRNVNGTVTTISLDTLPVADAVYRPCLVALPNGRTLLLSTNPNPDGASTYTIAAWVSDDDGATWSQQAPTTIRSSFATADYEPRRLRAAYSRGQVMMVLAVRSMVATTIPDLMIQYASADGGITFSEVDRTDGDTDNVHAGGVHEVLGLTSGSFALLYCGSSYTEWGGNSAVVSKRLASAWARMSRTTPTTVTELINPSAALSVANELSDSTELAACVDESGACYAVAQDFTTPGETLMSRSIDGATWTRVTDNVQAAFTHATAGYEWLYGSLTSWNGSLQLVSAWDSSAWPYQLGTTQLGCYSTATVPYWPVSDAAPDRMLPCTLLWVPFWLPATAGWTRAVVGAPTDVLATNGTLTLTAAVGEAISYTDNGTVWPMNADFMVAAVGEWIATSGRSELRVLGADSSASYGVRVRYSGTTVDVIDHYGGGTLGTFSVTAGVKIHVRALITVSGSPAATVYVGTSAGALSPIKPAVRVVNGAALTSGGASGPSSTVVWNQATQGASSWSLVAWGTRRDTSNPHAVTIPDTMPGRPFSPQPQLLDYGMSIRAVAGPAKVGDGWDVSNRYDYALSNVLASVAPSPRQTWRSTDTTQQTLVWELDTTAANVSPLRGPLGALYLGNVNFRTATLSGRNAAGSWITLGTIDTSASSSGLRWVRAGTIVEPDTSAATSAGYYWPYASLQGARFSFDTSIGPVRPIGASTEGNWTNAAAKRVRLLTTGSMAGVGSSGTAGAILHRSAILVWNTDADYSAFRLVIPSQPNYEGYYEIGTMVLGHVAAFGRRYSWGRQLTTEANTALTTGRSGVRRSQVLGPTRRSVEFGWSDGTDLTQVRQQGPADYVLATSSGGTEAVATPWDAPLAMAGLVAELRGADTPVVYLPWVERQASGTTYTAAHPDLMMFGRLVSDVSIEVVQGEEWIASGAANGEVVRTSSVRIEEEV
jgi:hypothetical protein